MLFPARVKLALSSLPTPLMRLYERTEPASGSKPIKVPMGVPEGAFSAMVFAERVSTLGLSLVSSTLMTNGASMKPPTRSVTLTRTL